MVGSDNLKEKLPRKGSKKWKALKEAWDAAPLKEIQGGDLVSLTWWLNYFEQDVDALYITRRQVERE